MRILSTENSYRSSSSSSDLKIPINLIDLHVADLAVNGIKNFREEGFEKVLGTKCLGGGGVGVNRVCALEERAR